MRAEMMHPPTDLSVPVVGEGGFLRAHKVHVVLHSFAPAFWNCLVARSCSLPDSTRISKTSHQVGQISPRMVFIKLYDHGNKLFPIHGSCADPGPFNKVTEKYQQIRLSDPGTDLIRDVRKSLSDQLGVHENRL